MRATKYSLLEAGESDESLGILAVHEISGLVALKKHTFRSVNGATLAHQSTIPKAKPRGGGGWLMC
ncbi:hypothetical protein ACLOJK_013749 [Asimina triloba]